MWVNNGACSEHTVFYVENSPAGGTRMIHTDTVGRTGFGRSDIMIGPVQEGTIVGDGAAGIRSSDRRSFHHYQITRLVGIPASCKPWYARLDDLLTHALNGESKPCMGSVQPPAVPLEADRGDGGRWPRG